MKKEITGYSIIWSRKEEPHTILNTVDGEALIKALNKGANFITISSRDMTIRAGTVDRVVANYKKLEEQCYYCHQLKPIRENCPRGCDEPKKYERTNTDKEDIGLIKRCKACDLPSKGEYCSDCKGLYE